MKKGRQDRIAETLTTLFTLLRKKSRLRQKCRCFLNLKGDKKANTIEYRVETGKMGLAKCSRPHS